MSVTKPALRAGALLMTLALPAAAGAAEPAWTQVAPLLAIRCAVCHSGDAAPLGLRLDSYEAALKGSQNGPVLAAGDVAGSRLLKRVRGEAQPRMPLTGPPFLSEAEIALLENWVRAGMPRGADSPAPGAAARPLPRPGEPVNYSHVAPIFLQRCAKCHSDNGIMGAPPEGFRLRTLAEMLEPGERVRVIPGNAGASEVVRRIKGQSTPRMPFDGPPWLSAAEIDLIERWIAGGAIDAEGRAAPVPVGAAVRFRGELTGEWAVDGTPVQVGRGTRIDKGPRVGDRVELRGVVEADGSISATRLRRR